MIIKNAYIEKVKNQYKTASSVDTGYDYLLILSESQFIDFRNRGLPAKISKHLLNDDFTYWIRLTPYYLKNRQKCFDISEEMEELFLYRDDLEIDVDIYSRVIHDYCVIKLYLNLENIRES